jgi:hypothetical protein
VRGNNVTKLSVATAMLKDMAIKYAEQRTVKQQDNTVLPETNI